MARDKSQIQKRIRQNIFKWRDNKLYKRVDKNVSLEQIREYCNDKSILIVGNSKEIIDSNYGEKIDSYDIVTRINHGHVKKMYANHMGRKYNIWAHGFLSSKMQKKEYKSIKNTIDYHISTNVYKLNLEINNSKCFIINNRWYKNEYEYSNNYEMSTGLNIVLFFSRFVDNLKSISIVGFDFFQSKNKELLSISSRFHNGEREEKIIKEELSKNLKYVPFNDKYKY